MIEATCLTIIGEEDLYERVKGPVEAYLGRIDHTFPSGRLLSAVFEGTESSIHSPQALLAALEIDGLLKDEDIRMGIASGEEAAKESYFLATQADMMGFRILMSEATYKATGESVEAFGLFNLVSKKDDVYFVGISLTWEAKPGEVPIYTRWPAS